MIVRLPTAIFYAVLLALFGDSSALTIEIDGEGATPNVSALSGDCNLAGKQSFTSDGSRTIFTDEQSASHGVSLKMTAPAGRTGFGTFGGIIDFRSCAGDSNFKLVKGDELWIRTRVLVPANWEWNSGRNKFLRFRTYYNDQGTVRSDGYNDLYIDGNPGGMGYRPFQFIFEGEQQWFGIGDLNDFFVAGQWKTIEMYLKLDNVKRSQGGDAVVRVWLDGELVGETFDRKTLNRPSAYISNFNYFTYYGNETSPQDQSLYVDDLIITTETPTNTDSRGNRYIGMGDFVPEPPPRAPEAR